MRKSVCESALWLTRWRVSAVPSGCGAVTESRFSKKPAGAAIPRGQERLHAFLVRLQEILGSSLHAVEWLSWGGKWAVEGWRP